MLLSLIQKAIVHLFFKTIFTDQFNEQNVASILREATQWRLCTCSVIQNDVIWERNHLHLFKWDWPVVSQPVWWIQQEQEHFSGKKFEVDSQGYAILSSWCLQSFWMLNYEAVSYFLWNQGGGETGRQRQQKQKDRDTERDKDRHRERQNQAERQIPRETEW